MAKALDENSKKDAINKLLANINKKYGAGTAMVLGDSSLDKIPVIPTGSLILDKELGIGGLPEGRIIEIYGPESSGKTTLTLHVIAEAQKQKKYCAFIDTENALDPKYARALGVDIDNIILSQPSCGEEALDLVEQFLRSDLVDLIVVDSVATLTPKAEIEGEMDDVSVGLQARLMSKALRKLNSAMSEQRENKCTILFTNQLRAKIGGMGYGPQETTTGGNALKFYSSVRLEIKRIGSEKRGNGEIYANNVRIKVVKNKLSSPFREANTKIFFGKGFFIYDEVLSLAEEYKYLSKSGAWYTLTFDGQTLKSQGREGMLKELQKEENQALFNKLKEDIHAKLMAEQTSLSESIKQSEMDEEDEDFVDEE